MKHILLLTDFSDNSINAIRYALQLFEEEVANFSLLHVQSSRSYTTDDLLLAGNTSLYDSIIKKTKHKLAKLVVEFESEFKNPNFSFKVLADYDILTDSINQVHASDTIDLIVMGTNGVTGAKEVVFGSNTINVIRKVDCPTLVIPEGFKYKKPNEVLLPLDVFDSLSGNAFMNIVKFLKRFSKTLHILRIKPQDEASKEEQKDQEHMAYFLKDMTYKYHIISNIPMHYAVDCYRQTHAIDLTTLIVQKERLFERFFMGSETTQIANNIREPFLIFHSH